MVNKCAYCTVMLFGIFAIIIHVFFTYGIAAGMFLLTALVLCCGIFFHAILIVGGNKKFDDDDIQREYVQMLDRLGHDSDPGS